MPTTCGIDAGTTAGTLTPLWERTIITILHESRDVNYLGEGGASPLDVHPNGLLALSVGGQLWIFDAHTGVPKHAVDSVGDENIRTNRPESPGTVVFTPDGNRVWLDTYGVTLVDLFSYDRWAGFKTPVASQGDGLGWRGRAPAVAADGTLFWLGNDGTLRATQVDGSTRWEVSGKNGVPVLASEDVLLLRHGPPQALDARTGRVLWEAPSVIDTPNTEILLADDALVRDVVPVFHLDAQFRAFVAMRRVENGSVEKEFRPSSDAGFSFEPTMGAMSDDDVLILASRFEDRVVAIDLNTRHERWSRDAELQSPPIAGKNGRVFLLTSDCNLSVVDSAGQVVEQFVMQGQPVPHIAQLQDGILYVLTELPQLTGGDPNDSRDWLYPGSARAPLVDGRRTYPEDYGCVASTCFVLKPGDGTFFKLYAFRVE